MTNKEIEKFRSIGYINTAEAAKLCGRISGSNIVTLFEGCGVNCLSQKNGKVINRVWLKSDLGKVPPLGFKSPQKGMSMVAYDAAMEELETRITAVEKVVEQVGSLLVKQHEQEKRIECLKSRIKRIDDLIAKCEDAQWRKEIGKQTT